MWMQIAVPIANPFPFALDISKLVAIVVVKDSLLFGPPSFIKIQEVFSESFSLLVTGEIVILNKVYFYFTLVILLVLLTF